MDPKKRKGSGETETTPTAAPSALSSSSSPQLANKRLPAGAVTPPRNGSKDKITAEIPVRQAGYSFKSAWEDDIAEEVEIIPPTIYKCSIRVIGAKGLRREGKLFNCYVKVRIPGGALATSSTYLPSSTSALICYFLSILLFPLSRGGNWVTPLTMSRVVIFSFLRRFIFDFYPRNTPQCVNILTASLPTTLSSQHIAIKKEETPFWDQSAVMEMTKKPNNLYVELMAHETKLLGAAKEAQVGTLKIPLRKFIRGM